MGIYMLFLEPPLLEALASREALPLRSRDCQNQGLHVLLQTSQWSPGLSLKQCCALCVTHMTIQPVHVQPDFLGDGEDLQSPQEHQVLAPGFTDGTPKPTARSKVIQPGDGRIGVSKPPANALSISFNK